MIFKTTEIIETNKGLLVSPVDRIALDIGNDSPSGRYEKQAIFR